MFVLLRKGGLIDLENPSPFFRSSSSSSHHHHHHYLLLYVVIITIIFFSTLSSSSSSSPPSPSPPSPPPSLSSLSSLSSRYYLNYHLLISRRSFSFVEDKAKQRFLSFASGCIGLLFQLFSNLQSTLYFFSLPLYIVFIPPAGGSSLKKWVGCSTDGFDNDPKRYA